MIKFDNWRISNEDHVLARQYDNLTRELRVEGNIPDCLLYTSDAADEL